MRNTESLHGACSAFSTIKVDLAWQQRARIEETAKNGALGANFLAKTGTGHVQRLIYGYPTSQ